MKVLIVDDELKSREVLKTLLYHFCPEVNQVETAGSVQDAIKTIYAFNPDLVFLDISLREGDSFSLLNNLKEINFEFAFITAYDEMSLKALQYADIPCLLKPIQIEDLIEVVQAFNQINQKGSSAKKYKKVQLLLHSNFEKIPVTTDSGEIIVSLNSLLKLQKKENKTLLFLENDEKIESKDEFRKFENLLDSKHYRLTPGQESVLIKYD
jgi:two-component system, LytTR family, response regulator